MDRNDESLQRGGMVTEERNEGTKRGAVEAETEIELVIQRE